MSILAECPFCKRKQSVKNKLCKCGEDLDKLKRSRKVRYWINYRLPAGKQRRELVGCSITEARDADGKRRVQKRENRIFDMLPDSKVTFDELIDWYLGLQSVAGLSSARRIRSALNNIRATLGDIQARHIKPLDLENYQIEREQQGAAFATIDMEISIAGTMINKAFDNDMLDGRVLKAFRSVKRKLKPGSNARSRLISVVEYLKIITEAPHHLKGIVITAYNSGMRMGEILGLRWSFVDRDNSFFRLPPELTKEDKPKNIPINHHVKKVLNNTLRAVHHDFVFSYRGNSFSEGGIKRSFKTACKSSGVPYGRKTPDGITFHDFRRTFKTSMLTAGVDKVFRDALVGHSLKGMDAHYLVLSDELLKNAMDIYTRWLDEKIAEAHNLLTKPLTKIKKSQR
jgi:integrase